MKKSIHIIIGITFLLFVSCGSPQKQDKQEEKTEPQTTEQINQQDVKEDASEQEQKEFEKPNKFPEEALKQVEESLSAGDPVLSLEKVDKVLKISQEFAGIEQKSPEEVEKLMKERGFNGSEEFNKIYIAALMSTEAIKSLEAMQAIIDASAEEKEAAKAFTLDDAMLSISHQILKSGQYTKADLQLIYDNWDKFVSFKKETDEMNKKTE